MPSDLSPPQANFNYLETLWFQISGTLCNLRCNHCFISCSPENHDLEMMETKKVFRYLGEARQLGVKEIYYTGGEPFLHKDFLKILEHTLRDFPATVLTNGLLITAERADQLKDLAAASSYSLELRISLDDHDEERNDAVRGKGTFRKVLAACKRLYDRGFLPILTVTEIQSYHQIKNVLPADLPGNRYRKYVELLESIGIERPRIKIIPVFEMGMLPLPTGGIHVTEQMMDGYDHTLLQCSSSRIVAHNGIYACPILVGQGRARLGKESLKEAIKPCSLYHSSCHTCYVTGMTCKNF